MHVQGNTLICPPGGFTLTATPPAGRLDGLTCYAATSALSVEAGVTATNTVESQVVVSSGHLSAFAAFGIFVAVVIAMGAVGGIGYMLWQRRVSLAILSLFFVITHHITCFIAFRHSLPLHHCRQTVASTGLVELIGHSLHQKHPTS